MPDEDWWTRLDLNIPESIPADLTTREACLRYVRKVLRDLVQIEKEHEAWKRKPEVEGNEVALVQADTAMNSLRDSTAEAIYLVMRKWATLEETRDRD